MGTLLLYDDSVRSPELRHEIAEAVADPVVFLDHDGRRIVVTGPFEVSIFATREDVVDEVWTTDELGIQELIRDESRPSHLIGPELVLRAVQRAGSASVVVPPTFRVLVADYLRAAGVEVVVDAPTWADRRRRKTPWEVEGIERAQRAAETSMLTATRLLREAEPTNDGMLRFEGELLTSELIREAMVGQLVALGAESEEVIVQSGDACFGGHELGSGPIAPDRSLIIDCFPRDRKTGAFSDMTRTFVVGEPSERLARLHAHCRRALDIAFEAIKPGASDVFARVAGYFESEGFATYLSHGSSEPVREGFIHALGHGVGLEVHERPLMGRRSDALVAGDVVAVEPGLYLRGVGGVRLEDTVLVTDDGFERFTDAYPYDLTP